MGFINDLRTSGKIVSSLAKETTMPLTTATMRGIGFVTTNTAIKTGMYSRE